MFFYTHVIADSYKESIFTSSSYSNIPSGDTVSFSESASASSNKTIAAGSVAEETIAAFGNTAPEYDSNGNFDSYGVTAGGPDTEIKSTTYSYGTAPRSVTQRTATRTTIVGTFNSSSTFTIGPAGSSTGVDSISYTIPATATTVKTQAFATVGSGTATTVLSATASATDTTTGSSTATLASATTLVPFFALSMQTVQRWYEARQNPPPLRRAGIVFAATHGSSTGAVTSLAAGSNAFLSDLSITTSSSSSEIILGAPLPETRRTHATYFVGNKGSYTHSTAASILSAARRQVSGGFFHDGSLFAGPSYSPSVAATWTNGVSVASGLKTASIFTTPEADSNTTYRWFFDGTSWLLLATSSNTVTTSAYTVTYTFTGIPSTSAFAATYGIGVTTALLGPIQPFTTSSLHVVSVSTQNTGGASAFFTGRNSSTAGSSSASTSSSSSQTYAIGSATDDQPATFPASDLSYAVAHVAASVSTQLSSGFSGIPGATFDAGSIPSLFSAAKWNEAGRGDAVSVDQ